MLYTLYQYRNTCPELEGIISRKSRRNTMLDLRFVRENPDIVKQNIKNKFQDSKLPLVD